MGYGIQIGIKLPVAEAGLVPGEDRGHLQDRLWRAVGHRDGIDGEHAARHLGRVECGPAACRVIR